MAEESVLLFDAFRVDLSNERLWRRHEALPLPPKAFAVLRYLVERPGQLVTKAELFKAVWPDIAVGDAVLTVGIGELRKALGDDPQAPRFIETVHRRGYRFLAPVTTGSPSLPGAEATSRSHPAALLLQAPRFTPRAASVVGRAAEIGQLQQWLEKALSGERQIVFVTGEPGIGKTAVVEAFLEQVAMRGNCWIGQGQCIEHYGVGEAYLPVLDALGQLCRQPGEERLLGLLDQQAPTWLVQMPALLTPADLEALQRKTLGATRERMLREMAEAVEVLTAERLLVLWLEDLQWSDYATLDLVSFLARRRQPARLLVLGTYRPVEVIMREHPLKAVKQELQLHGQCAELPLGLLSEAAVGEYLTQRFPAHRLPVTLARVLHQRTDGNPLFMVNIMRDWVAQEVIGAHEGQWVLQRAIEAVAGTMPQNLRQMIEQQLARLSPQDQRMLEAASVVGKEFSAAAVAVGVEEAVEVVEEHCEDLVRRDQMLGARGTADWPDGTVAACYGFVHALYQEVLYKRVTEGRRVRLHQRMGERLEAAYGARVDEIAAELAMHFERGRDYGRAVQYLEQAAQRTLQRSAHREAISLLTKGLELLKTLPDTPERAQQELALQLALSTPLMATKGYAAPAVEQAYTRARELCQQLEESPQLFLAVAGLWGFYLVRAELQTAHKLVEQLLRLAQSAQDPVFLLEAHRALGETLLWLGELAPARAHLEQAAALYDPQQLRSYVSLHPVNDPRVLCLSREAWTLWLLGYPDQALKRSYEALSLAQELPLPFSLAMALDFTAATYQVRREERAVQKWAEEAITLSTEQGFLFWLAFGTILRGWALAEQGQGEEGIAQMRQGLAAFWATGAELARPYFLALLAEAHGKVGQVEEGLSVLAEALAVVSKTGERIYEVGLHRLKGELTLQQFNVQGSKFKVANPQSLTPNPQAEAEAEACFLKAIEIARKQQAKSLELRASMSLSRLWKRQGKKKQARQLLTEVYGWFTEGFDTADLKEAKALLTELA